MPPLIEFNLSISKSSVLSLRYVETNIFSSIWYLSDRRRKKKARRDSYLFNAHDYILCLVAHEKKHPYCVHFFSSSFLHVLDGFNLEENRFGFDLFSIDHLEY